VNIGFIILAFLLLSKKTATATPLSARPGSTAANARGGAPSQGKPAGGPAPAGAGRGGSNLLSSVEDFFGFSNLDSPNLINPFDSGPLVSPADSSGIIGGFDGTVDDPEASGAPGAADFSSIVGSFNDQNNVPQGPDSVDPGADPGSDPGTDDSGDFFF
jgi:hypothetical protein